MGLQPLTVPGRVMGALVCYLLPIIAIMLYKGWLLRQFDANQRSRAGSSGATGSSTSAQKATLGAQDVDKPAILRQRASSSSISYQLPRAATASDTGRHQQGGLVQPLLDLPGGNFYGAPVTGGGSVQLSATAAAASVHLAAGNQFVYTRPKGCLQRRTVAVKVMYAVVIILNRSKNARSAMQMAKQT